MTKKYTDRYIFALLSLVVTLWGVNVVMIKYLTTFYPPLALAPIRLFLATCLLLPAVLRKYGYVRPPRAAWLPIAGVAACSIFFHQITLTWGVTETSATHAVLILGLSPLLTALLASYLVRERLTGPKLVGVILGFGGVVLVVHGKAAGAASLVGDAVMVVSMLMFVIGSLFVKKSTELVSPLLVTAYSHVLGSAGLLVLGFFVNPVWCYDGAGGLWPMLVLLFSSFVNTALGALWWNTGIQQIGASTTAIFQNGVSVVGVFASAMFLHEEIGLVHIAALVLVFLGVSLGTGVLNVDRPFGAMFDRQQPKEDEAGKS
ncbi:MAG: DMT family transporter [Negativicutes bacterium]|nr:DMT family transporter [Negativicutes bacterium]